MEAVRKILAHRAKFIHAGRELLKKIFDRIVNEAVSADGEVRQPEVQAL